MATFDEIWKEIIEKLFKQFTCFYMPDLAIDIDFTEGYTFLEKELQTIAPKSKDTKRFVDKLVKVSLKNGQEQWIIVHLEVQFSKQKEFPERMFRYFYRIYDKYRQKIVSLAVFTGKSKSYPLKFQYDFYQTELAYKYRTVKLIDYEEEYLLSQTNPFALVTLAVKYGLESKSDEELRYKFKRKLIRLMFEQGYSEDEILEMFRFIEIILQLKDEKFKELIYEEIEKYQEVKNKMVITEFEKRAIKKGKKERDLEIANKLLKKKTN
mgnify:FL=1